jgi:hypothetical protein
VIAENSPSSHLDRTCRHPFCYAVFEYAHSLIGEREEKREKMREKEALRPSGESGKQGLPALTEREVASQKSLSKIP